MKAICLVSGGVDSATSAAIAKSEGYELYCLSFNYGQLAQRELESAKKIAKALGAKEHHIVGITFLRDLYGKGVTSLMDKKIPMPGKFEPSVIVPFRNGIMLAIAAGYADSVKADAIFYGPQGDDAPFFPDCRKEFVSAMSKAIAIGTDSKLSVKNPLAKKSKADVIKLAVKLGVPVEQTWSCYLNGKVQCGRCESCNNRKNAFKAAGIKDSTKYAG
ncbi:MAG: 7-cyano-7-deazaguanine synthase QueC [Methanobacteriota archaeon]